MEDRAYYPEDRIPLRRLIPLGMQHVVAMSGATVLSPVLMGFDPQTAVFFSGGGTLIFIAIKRFKVPSYLGSSFAFIGTVLAVVLNLLLSLGGADDPQDRRACETGA